MFKHQFKSPTEYMLVTEDGDTEHVKPAEQTCDYGAGFFAKADSGAECEDCGSNALHFGDIDISESTSMEVISCIDCGNIQQ